MAWILAAFLMADASPASGEDETSFVLTEGEGKEQVQASCSMCHSLDYIVMNSPFQDRAGWERTVRKMVTVMGAPMSTDEIAAVVDYLARHYSEPE